MKQRRLWHLRTPLILHILSQRGFISIQHFVQKDTTHANRRSEANRATAACQTQRQIWNVFVVANVKTSRGRLKSHDSLHPRTHSGAGRSPIVCSFLSYLETTFVQIKWPTRAVIYNAAAAHCLSGIILQRCSVCCQEAPDVCCVFGRWGFFFTSNLMFWTRLRPYLLIFMYINHRLSVSFYHLTDEVFTQAVSLSTLPDNFPSLRTCNKDKADWEAGL